MRSYLLTLLALATLLAFGCTPVRGGGGGDDDDDDSGPAEDDDDAQPDDDDVGDDDDVQPDDDDVGDDDDVQPDDDDVQPDDDDFSGNCDYTETEPNDDGESINDLGTVTGTFTVCGDVDCGAGDAYGNLDLLAFTAGVGGSVSFSLEWSSSNTDMDGYVIDNNDPENPLHNYEEGTAFESGVVNFTEGGVYLLQVGCWSGTAGDWYATFDF